MTKAELKEGAPTYPADRRLIAGRYRVGARIGGGRLGKIYAATDEGGEEPGGGQRLAIQIVPASIVHNNKLFNKLNLGYTQLRACAHPNIVEYLQFGRHAKLGFLVMELLDGASLRDVLNDAETLPLDEAKPVIFSIGEALRLLHSKDMVHGNLTTKNVFITEALEVRLLDVLPIDPAESIVGGTAMSDAFNRCTVEDDVFGLACLAYEILAGQHPFNFYPPVEARLAGLEADRIATLTDSEWNALRHALSLEREQRTTSVANFFQEFGISGTERLRPTPDRPTSHESVVYLATEETPQITKQAVPAHSTAVAAPIAAIESVWEDEHSPTPARPSRRRSPMRAVFLGMLLAVLIAWTYYGQPQEQIVSLLGYIDENFDLPITSQRDGMIEIPIPDTVASVPAGRVAPVDDPAATAPAASDDDTLANSAAKRDAVERATTIDAIVPAFSQPADQPAVPSNGDNATGTGDNAADLTANEVAAGSDAVPQQMAPEVSFAKSIVSVSEGAGAARIALVRAKDSTMPLVWWTREHSARAGPDFISVGQQAVADASAEDGNILHIPLVNDNLPERRESFFVIVGRRDPRQGQIERIATVRVDIIDND